MLKVRFNAGYVSLSWFVELNKSPAWTACREWILKGPELDDSTFRGGTTGDSAKLTLLVEWEVDESPEPFAGVSGMGDMTDEDPVKLK
jgi:hypothetical protein